MKVTDIAEAPVVSQDYTLDRKPGERSSFDSPDDKKIASEKWRESLVGKWRDPHEFRLHFLDVSEDTFTDSVVGRGKLSDPRIIREFIPDYHPDPRAINVIYYSNEIVNGVGHLTPWILAHRFGHMIIPEMIKSGFVGVIGDGIEKLVKTGALRFKTAWGKDVPVSDLTVTPSAFSLYPIFTASGGEIDPGPAFSEKYCTFKSRDSLENNQEFVYELIAQKIVTGSISLVKRRKFSSNTIIENMENDLNSTASSALDSCVGHTYIM